MGNLAADGPRGGKVSAADQAAIDEALFADTEGSLLTEGPGASTQELEKDLAMGMAGWRPPRPCAGRRRGRRRLRRAHESVRERPRGDRGANGTPWEKIADHYRMTSLL